VVSLGTAVVDYFAKVDDKFLLEHKIRKGSTNFMPREDVDRFERLLGKKIFLKSAGDNGRNTCEGIARLGGSCAYASNLGKDVEATIFAKSLEDAKVEPDMPVLAGRTGKIIALITPDKERTFVADLGCTLDYKFGSEIKKAIKNSKIFYATSITTNGKNRTARSCISAMKFAKKNDVLAAYSLESPYLVGKNRKQLLALIPKYVDILFANESELFALTGKKSWKEALAASEKLCGSVVLKLGKRGSVISFGKKRTKVGIVKPKRVVDTTGAGDYYAAGFLFGMCRECEPLECGKIGAYLATKSIELFGARIPKKLVLRL